MYANLRVTIDGEPEPVMAWKVVRHDNGALVIYHDAQDGGGSYAVPAGTRVVRDAATVSITACF